MTNARAHPSVTSLSAFRQRARLRSVAPVEAPVRKVCSGSHTSGLISVRSQRSKLRVTVVGIIVMAVGIASVAPVSTETSAVATDPLRIDYWVVALPLGTAGLIVGRWLWRKWLPYQCHTYHYPSRVVVVGSSSSRDNVEYTLCQIAEESAPTDHVAGVVSRGNRTPRRRQLRPRGGFRFFLMDGPVRNIE